MREVIETPRAPRPVAAYSQACRVGPLLAVAGQVGVDPASGRPVGDDVGIQTRQALHNVHAVLEAAGRSWDDVVRLDCYLSGSEHLGSFNEAYSDWFNDSPPARTTVFVGLPTGLLVEVTALAVYSDQ